MTIYFVDLDGNNQVTKKLIVFTKSVVGACSIKYLIVFTKKLIVFTNNFFLCMFPIFTLNIYKKNPKTRKMRLTLNPIF